MLNSKQKETLKHYKSLQNFHNKDNKLNKSIRLTQNQSLKLNKTKEKIQSRLATQINEQIVTSKEQLKKFAKIFKTQTNNKKDQKKKKNLQSGKSIYLNTLTKNKEKSRQGSPIITKFMHQHEKKVSKKNKNQKSHILFTKNSRQKSTKQINKKSKNKQSKSKQRIIKKNHNQKFQIQNKIQKTQDKNSFDSTPSCIIFQDMQILDLIGQGTFGKVYLGQNKKTKQIFAIKKVIQDSRYKNRQIQIISLLNNQFVCQTLGTFITNDTGEEYLNIIMKYYPQNLFQRIKNYPSGKMPRLQTKIILYQVIKGLSYLHSLNICHRDIKPQNILLKQQNTVICDFGSAKILNEEANISYICARCYRAPQLIFGSTSYNTQIDMWSVGCVILEILNGDPLFIGQTSINHLLQIFKVLGTPTPKQVLDMNPEYDLKSFKFPSISPKKWKQIFPSADPSLIQLIQSLLVYSPQYRLNAQQALAMEYFDQLRDQLTYTHLSGMYHLGDFFDFSQQELSNCRQLKSRLIPYWYEQF